MSEGAILKIKSLDGLNSKLAHQIVENIKYLKKYYFFIEYTGQNSSDIFPGALHVYPISNLNYRGFKWGYVGKELRLVCLIFYGVIFVVKR